MHICCLCRLVLCSSLSLQWRLYIMGCIAPVDQLLVIKPLHCNSPLSTGAGHTAGLCGVWLGTHLGHVGLNMDKTSTREIIMKNCISVWCRLEAPSESGEVKGVITGTKDIMSTFLQFCNGFLKEVCVRAHVHYLSSTSVQWFQNRGQARRLSTLSHSIPQNSISQVLWFRWKWLSLVLHIINAFVRSTVD